MLTHTNAVAARIRTLTPLATKVFLLTAPRDANGAVTAKAPYAVLQPSDGLDTADRFTGPPVTSHPRFVLHVVGKSYENAQTATELIKAKFITPGGFALEFTTAEVPGQSGKHLHWSSAQPTQVDDDVKPPLIYNTIELGWTSDPI